MPQEIRNQQALIVKVISRDGILFDATADSITSYNDQGLFDVLSMHTNFISIIHKEIILRRAQVITNRMPITTGILIVKANRVEVYLGILHD